MENKNDFREIKNVNDLKDEDDVQNQDNRSSTSSRSLAQSLKDGIRTISNFYEHQYRVLTSNFAGAADDNDDSNSLDPLVEERKNTIPMTISKYQYLNHRGELGFWPTLFTFIKVNTVAGFLFLPAGFKNGGWLYSIFAIIAVACLVIYCNISLSECTDAANSYSFSRIGFKAAGKFGYYLVEFGIAISQICFPCSYANLITQYVNNMINFWFHNDENYFLYIGLGLGCILIPMCLVRNLNKFASFHLIGDIAMLATIICLAYESIFQITHNPDFNLDHVYLINTGWAKLLGMAVTSLEGIGVILPIKENMREKQKFKLVIIIGTMVISLILTIFPMIMYLCYQDKVNEIVLNNLPLGKIHIQIILALLIFSVLIVYPVALSPAFKILGNMFFKYPNKEKPSINITKTTETEEKIVDFKTYMLENLLRIVIVIITITLGVFSINRFDTLLSLVGCSICTPIAIIIPSIFHYQLYKKIQSNFRNCCDIFFATIGCILSLTVLIFTLI